MKKYFLLPAVALMLAGCSKTHDADSVIFSCDSFTVFADSVVQGDFTARAVSPFEITTTYRSPMTAGVSPVVEFRFSINSRDNEMGRTLTHRALISKADNGFVYTFGSTEGEPAIDESAKDDTLALNTPWHIRVDMRPMLRAFAREGRYVTPTGDVIEADDFKGLWIAGSVAPLNWDFENLYAADDRRLTPGPDSIFEATIAMNPPRVVSADPQGWRIDGPVKGYPTFDAEQLLPAACYNMAIEEITSDIRPDSTFRAGREWDGVWTRDVSYSIYLSLAALAPDVSMNSLRAKVKDGRIVQDTGTGGAWPVSTDRQVWALAAWEIYKVTGDRQWLAEAADIIEASLRDDLKVTFDKDYRLFHGEQSYLDWREQTYPYWMQPADIFQSMTLGTNVVFAQATSILAMMKTELGHDSAADWEALSKRLTESINYHLWAPDKGIYCGYLYGAPYTMQSPATDNLGQSLAILFGVATPDMARSIISRNPVVDFGTPSVYPQQGEIRPYHNNAVWPFVQAYWNLAAAKTGSLKALSAGLGAIYRAQALFSTNKELFIADSGDYRGTAINSDAQLWSAAGSAAMVLRVFAGIHYEADAIEFHPVVPPSLKGTKRLNGLRYRNATIDITIEGTGNKIASFVVDGTPSDTHRFEAAKAEGHHVIEIRLANNSFGDAKFNLTGQAFMPAVPVVDWADPRSATFNAAEGISAHEVYLNGVLDSRTDNDGFVLSAENAFTQVNIAAVDKDNVAGFVDRPHYFFPSGSLIEVPIDVMTTPTSNPRIAFAAEIQMPGEYFVSVLYANGSGPINTENKCAIRTLIVNNAEAGPVVMPQRGTGEWLSSGYSNTLRVNLVKGLNSFSIDYIEPQNRNMNGTVNDARIISVRIIKK